MQQGRTLFTLLRYSAVLCSFPGFVMRCSTLYLVREHPLGEEDRSRETAEKTLPREPGQLNAALPFRRQFQSAAIFDTKKI
jgi:hypothetical protein